MKKTSFFKLFLVGAAALALGFTSCQDSPTNKEFQELCEKVSLLEDGIDGLTEKLNAIENGDFVVKVTKKEGTTNVLVVDYYKREDVEITITNGVSSIEAKEGTWWVDGVNTGVLALTQSDLQALIAQLTGGDTGLTEEEVNALIAAKIGSFLTQAQIQALIDGSSVDIPAPRINEETGKWEFPTLTDGEIGWAAGPDAGNPDLAYAVLNDGKWTLRIPSEDSEDGWATIPLPSNEVQISKIDILGWVKNFTAGNDPTYQDGDLTINQRQIFGGEDALNVNFGWMGSFPLDEVDTASSDTGANALDAWTGGKKQFAKGQVINTLVEEKKGLLVQVHPGNADANAVKNFILQNSKSGVLPINLGTPVKVTGLLTRAASESALWFIPGGEQWATKYLGRDASGYTNLFVDDALYSLVNADNFRSSEYTDFTVTATSIESFEAALNNYLTYDTNKQLAPANGMFEALVGTTYGIDFTVTKPISGVTDDDRTTDTVMDYYITMSPDTDNQGQGNKYVQDMFKVSFPDNGQKILIGHMPDKLTLTNFQVRVYKLGIDGVVYIEDITIFPKRDVYGANIRTVNYKVTDVDGMGTTASKLSAVDAGSMKAMFDELAKHEASAEGNTTLEYRWKHQIYGAKFWALKSVGTRAYNSTGAFTDMNAATFLTWKNDYFAAGGKIAFATSATATTMPTTAAQGIVYDNTVFQQAPEVVQYDDLYKAQALLFQPPYVKADGTTPFFELDKTYCLTFEFYDGNDVDLATYVAGEQGDKVSYLTVIFTPYIPTFTGFFNKVPDYWVDNTLMAYYKAPSAWDTNYFYRDGFVPFGAATSTFYNVYKTDVLNSRHGPRMPYDGGFDQIGKTFAATDKEWVDGGIELQYDGTLPNYLAIGEITTPADTDTRTVGKKSVVELKNQTPWAAPLGNNTPGYFENEATATNAATDVLPMRFYPGKYLGVYEYTPALHKDMLDALKFKMQIMSALEHGTITGANADGTIDFQAGTVGVVDKIRANEFIAKNYNNTMNYSLFKDEETGKYTYTYIKEVKFFIPNDNSGQVYVFADENGGYLRGQMETEALQDADGYYVGIIPDNISTSATPPSLGVRVLDRFGKVKEATIKLNIVVN